MPARSFVDSNGVIWTVWQVLPYSRERRSGVERRSGRDRRSVPHRGGISSAERRVGSDRRLVTKSRGYSIPGYEGGWLCFDSADERRRLAPIPDDWDRCTDSTLARYCHAATVTTARRTA